MAAKGYSQLETLQGLRSVDEVLASHEQSPESELWADYEDSTIADVCDAHGIYLTVWASRTCTVVSACSFIIAMVIQICIPAALLHKSWDGLHSLTMRLPWDLESAVVKSESMVLFIFLNSTFSTCINRANVMDFMAPLLKARPWALQLGAYTCISCILLSSVATLSLFVQNPTVGGVLLNCIALNFLPDVDLFLIGVVSNMEPERFQDTKQRVVLVKEAWPTSTDREENKRWWSLDIKDKLSARPRVVFIFFVRAIMRVFSLFLPIASFLVVNPETA